MLSNGTLSYYKRRDGYVMPHEHNLGTALAVLCGVLEGDEAIKALENYPTYDKGIPLIHPYLPNRPGSHNTVSWPFCSTFFLWAKEKATGIDQTDYNAALLARSMGTKLDPEKKPEWGGFGSFHEQVMLPSGIIGGSGDQLWSSASYINVCLRAGVIDGMGGVVE